MAAAADDVVAALSHGAALCDLLLRPDFEARAGRPRNQFVNTSQRTKSFWDGHQLSGRGRERRARGRVSASAHDGYEHRVRDELHDDGGKLHCAAAELK